MILKTSEYFQQVVNERKTTFQLLTIHSCNSWNKSPANSMVFYSICLIWILNLVQ